MKIRRVSSFTALLSFLVLMFTSLILYITPFGRTAYWADWSIMGLSKDQWGSIHINVGLLFLTSILFHIFYNWKPLITYLKNRKKELSFVNREFLTALALTLFFTAGTLGGIPPLTWILELSDSVKNNAARTYGEPPYGHAELSSISTFCSKVGLDAAQSVKNLKDNGINVTNQKQTLKELARKSGRSPQEIYILMKGDLKEEKKHGLPGNPPAGLGKLSIEELSSKYNLSAENLLQVLWKMGLEATPSSTLKSLAAQKNTSPMDIYEGLRRSQI